MIQVPHLSCLVPEGARLQLKLINGTSGEVTINAGKIVQTANGRVLSPEDVLEVLAPIEPGKIIGIGLNDSLHAKEMGKPIPEEPLMFLKSPTAVTRPGAPIFLPLDSQQVDFEGEVALVIGVPCRHVPEEKAHEVVMGLTIANDVTARDFQRKDVQFSRAKSFDSFCPLGPYVAALSLDKPLTIQTFVNGELRQNADTSRMIHNFRKLIAYASRAMTLLPGDVILTGTYEGVGPLAAGDEVRVVVENLGELVNPVLPAPEASYFLG